MKAKDVAEWVLKKPEGERVDAIRKCYRAEISDRVQRRFNRPQVRFRDMVPLYKEMSFWVELIIDRVGLKETLKPRDFDADFNKHVV